MSEPTLHIVLHQPEIPQNTGNIARTCVALGAKLWLVRPLGFQITDKQVRRAGLDYWPHLDLEIVDTWADLLAALPSPRRWLFTKTAERSYFAARYQQGDVLVFGSETRGLPQELLGETPEQNVRIPIRPEVRSLNLGNAVAAAAYEALRQIEGLGPTE